MLKVLLVGPSRDAVSGVSTHLNQIFDSAITNRFRLFHFQVGSEGRAESTVEKVARLLVSPISFLSTLISIRPQIVHLNSSLEPKAYWRDLVYLIIAKLLSKKVVYQVHGGELPQYFLGESRIAQAFLRWSLSLPDALVVLANREMQAYAKFGKFSRLRLIPNAIKLSDYRDFKPRLFKNRRLVLGYIGRLADDKGIRETLEALILLRENNVEFRSMYIAGSGPMERDLKEFVREHNLGSLVNFISPVFGDEKIKFWQNIDIFVFPTYHREGLPYTVLESMAAGVPIVTTPVGGIVDAVEDGINGILLESGSPLNIADALWKLDRDRGLLESMSRECIRRSRDAYGVERLVYQFTTLYEEVIG